MSEQVKVTGLRKDYSGQTEPALKNVNLSVQPGRFVIIVGPSGCGKSTLINIICNLEEASSGDVDRPESVAMVFQSGALLPWFSAWQNVALVLEAKGLHQGAIDRATNDHLNLVGLGEFKHKYPRELSGGQRQRVGLARALAVDPELLVLDEPFSALDIQTTEYLHQDLLKIWQATGKTILMVSHSIEEAVTLADEVVLMKRGGVEKVFDLSAIPRPRREQATDFIREVQKIRQAFLAE